MNSLSGSDTGGVFGASVVEVFKPEFLLSHPEDILVSEHCQHQIPQLKDKVKARRKVDGGPGLGKQEARQVQQPQIPTERETETGCHRGRFQQTPRRPVLPAKD